MDTKYRWLLPVALLLLVGLGCQAQGPLEPFLGTGHQVAVLGDGEGEVPPPKDPYDNLGDCVNDCTAKAHEYFNKCLSSGEAPDVCAEKAKSFLRDCVDRCRKQCQADCEEARQLEYQRCIAAGNPPWKCAKSANAAAERCKQKCRGAIKH